MEVKQKEMRKTPFFRGKDECFVPSKTKDKNKRQKQRTRKPKKTNNKGLPTTK